MAQFTSAGGGGVPSVASIAGATNPAIARVPIATPNVEQSYVLPADTKKYMITVFTGELKLAYVSGDSALQYQTIPRWCFLSDDSLSLAGTTLYFQSPVAGHTIIIRSWA